MDNEVKGAGNSYDFGARLYDPRVARWMACDPLAAKYSDNSPFNFVANSPLIFIDPDGKRIKGVRINKKTGELEYTKAALKNGTKEYIESRMVTEEGKKEIMSIIHHKKKVKIITTDKVLLDKYYDPTEKKMKYSIVRGITTSDGKVIAVSTADKSYDEISESDDFGVLSADGLIKKVYDMEAGKDFELDDVQNPFDPDNLDKLPERVVKAYEEIYRAYVESGKKKYDLTHEYKSKGEILHSVGAHEETHLKDIWEGNQSTLDDPYKREYKAFTKEVRARENYKKETKERWELNKGI